MAGTQTVKIINILLGSVNGKIATHEYESSCERRTLKFTNTDDFKHLQKLTAKCDAVFIGAKSIQSEKGAFRVAHLRKDNREPHWFVMTKSGNIDFQHPFWEQKHIQKSVFHLSACGLNMSQDDNPYNSYYKGNIFDFLKTLPSKKIKKIALLGGGELNGFFWEHNLISDLHLTVSPNVLGDNNAPQLISSNHALHTRLHLKHVKQKGDFLFLHYIVHKKQRNNIT